MDRGYRTVSRGGQSLGGLEGAQTGPMHAPGRRGGGRTSHVSITAWIVPLRSATATNRCSAARAAGSAVGCNPLPGLRRLPRRHNTTPPPPAPDPAWDAALAGCCVEGSGTARNREGREACGRGVGLEVYVQDAERRSEAGVGHRAELGPPTPKPPPLASPHTPQKTRQCQLCGGVARRPELMEHGGGQVVETHTAW